MSNRPVPDGTTLVVGTGYLGGRVLAASGAAPAVGLSRSAATLPFDLDTGGPLPIDLPVHYRVLYTVPPAPAGAGDARLPRLLAALDPAP